MFSMIKTLRIDDRLIHGQTMVSWCAGLDLDSLVVANDEAANNEVTSMTLKMAVPPNIQVAIKEVQSAIELLRDPRCQRMSMMVITKTPKDALVVLEAMGEEIPYVVVGNYGQLGNGGAGKVQLGKTIYATPEEVEILKKISRFKPDSVAQQVLATPATKLSELLKDN